MAWFNEPALGCEAHTRYMLKRYLLHIITHRLRPGVNPPRAWIPIKEVRAILTTFSDYKHAKPETARKWAARTATRLQQLPCIAMQSDNLHITFFNDTFGTDEQIEKFHTDLAVERSSAKK